MAIIIPHDVLLHQILPRLPTRSVARFMCVSKELQLFLSSEAFKTMHKKMQNRYEKFLFLINDYKELRMVGTIDCEAPNGVLTFKLPVEFKYVSFQTSFDGLVVCVYISYTTKIKDDLVLWNPLTSDWKMLSKPKFHYWGSLVLFYSSCEDDYKLVSVSCYDSTVNVYSLKSDSWKTVDFKGISDLENYQLSQGTYLNENVYFLNANKKYSVVRFDTKTDMFTEMNTTYLNHDIEHYSATLMIKNGCIHVCITYKSYVRMACFEIELWKIDEEGNWKKVERYRLDTGYMHFIKPLHLTRNGNLLMLGTKFKKSAFDNYNSCKGKFYNVDLKKKHSKGIGKDNQTRCSDMEIFDYVRYTETTVSPNQYMK